MLCALIPACIRHGRREAENAAGECGAKQAEEENRLTNGVASSGAHADRGVFTRVGLGCDLALPVKPPSSPQRRTETRVVSRWQVPGQAETTPDSTRSRFCKTADSWFYSANRRYHRHCRGRSDAGTTGMLSEKDCGLHPYINHHVAVSAQHVHGYVVAAAS